MVRDFDAINRAVSLTVGGVARGDHVRDQRGQRARRLVVARKKHVGLCRSTAVYQRSIATPHVATGHLWLRETARHSAALFAQTRLREKCNVRLWSDEALTKHRLIVCQHSLERKGAARLPAGHRAADSCTAAACDGMRSGQQWRETMLLGAACAMCVRCTHTLSLSVAHARACTRTHMHSAHALTCTVHTHSHAQCTRTQLHTQAYTHAVTHTRMDRGLRSHCDCLDRFG